jgi:hypothetical protein
MLQLLDGSYVKPAVVGRAEISTHAVGGAAHRYLYTPEYGRVFAKRGMRQKECRGYSDYYFINMPTCLDYYEYSQSPQYKQLVSNGQYDQVQLHGLQYQDNSEI